MSRYKKTIGTRNLQALLKLEALDPEVTDFIA